MNVRCPVCSAAVVLAVGDTQLACTACGLAAPLSHVGTAPGAPASAVLALELDLTGTKLAGRSLVSKIGAGGMGTVYRARGDSDPGDVAVKVLRPGLGAERAAMLARFAREAEAMRRLEHPRVVRFLDHGEDGDSAFIVTELVEGQDLAARLAKGRLTLAEIVDVFGQVCDGVAAAHAAGIVHRDLKPANILVGADGVKVADFGLAQLGPDIAVTTLTRTDVAMGTFHYLAPEQRKDARNVDHRADIWALGVIFYEMLTGELPLGSFVAPSALGPPGCDRRVDAIVRRALSPDPAQRYAAVTDLARDVRSIITRPRIRQYAAIAAAVALMATGTTAVAFALSSDDEKPTVAASTTPDAAVATFAGGGTAFAPMDAPELDAFVAIVTPDAAIDAAAIAALEPVKPPIKPALGKPGGGKGKTSDFGKVPVGKPPVKRLGGKSKKAEPEIDEEDKVVGKPEEKPTKIEKDSVVKDPPKEPTPAVCRTTQRCCTMVGGGNCASWLTSTADACTSALTDFRGKAKNPKQLGACGVTGPKGGK